MLNAAMEMQHLGPFSLQNTAVSNMNALRALCKIARYFVRLDANLGFLDRFS